MNSKPDDAAPPASGCIRAVVIYVAVPLLVCFLLFVGQQWYYFQKAVRPIVAQHRCGTQLRMIQAGFSGWAEREKPNGRDQEMRQNEGDTP